MKKAEERLAEETERVEHYLDESTHPKIKEVAERELIAAHMRPRAEMETRASSRCSRTRRSPTSRARTSCTAA